MRETKLDKSHFSSSVLGGHWRGVLWFWVLLSLDMWGAISGALTTQAAEISHKCDGLAAVAWGNKLRA